MTDNSVDNIVNTLQMLVSTTSLLAGRYKLSLGSAAKTPVTDIRFFSVASANTGSWVVDVFKAIVIAMGCFDTCASSSCFETCANWLSATVT